ncbi:PIN domain-containing protein [uncultured Anaerococcus sp.]|uniref:PIN/TRAM domain-containing protein n=1 Tax=uncultured Anaerococcus sp. TaxID=293428 RepID=UPI0025CCA8B9|nr:PIN domain-containing protein [uncultured Anaerococcus sp.]
MKRIIRLVFTLIGAVLGIVVLKVVNAAFGFIPNSGKLFIGANILASALFAFIFYLIADPIANKATISFSSLEKKISKLPAANLVIGVLGIILGFLVAALASTPLTKLSLPVVGNSIFVLLSILLYIGFGYLGWRLAIRNADDLIAFMTRSKEDKKEKKEKIAFDRANMTASPKVLDTSVIIDGRILDIINTDFLEGELIVTEFVLEELQHIADSPDDLKRERGRRGLDIIKKIQETDKINLKVLDKDYEDIKEVDAKLLKLALDLGAKVFTNDYNLSKVANVQGIPILNINDLANALKPVVIPGELMQIEVIKEGKGKNQGVGYLEDGTMVVVEDGADLIDQVINAKVTSVLQTSAGRMIFVRSEDV